MTSKPNVLTVMAFDYGHKRIGIAVGQTVSRTATALKVLTTANGQPKWNEIADLVKEWGPDLFVVGIPFSESHKTNSLRTAIERFSRRLTGRYQRPVSYVDERLSSYAANYDEQAATSGLDAVAAKMILLTWLAQTNSIGTATNQ
ncbi:MAG TPA: Holliday junction resolvase RuvX [Gammaproteobacteria bacterium]|nr:Holliday junction resolvase RuvX [Gammaproteobacteria bacterium]|tara:strand:+ start:750 stop:1184 length:435 start_codon:yes stop_codon:yes gene_type:complete